MHFARVVKAIYRADDLPCLVKDGSDMNHRPEPRSVGPLNDGFDTANCFSGAQHLRHRRLGSADWLAVEEETIRATEELGVIADAGRAPPEGGSKAVEP